MAWSAGVDKAVGDLITAAIWNNYYGTTSSVDYLKTELDKIPTISATDRSGVRAMDTVYQNTSGKQRLVVASIEVPDGDEMIVKTDGISNPPTIPHGVLYNNSGGAACALLALCAVEPGHRYIMDNVGAAACGVLTWMEYDFH